MLEDISENVIIGVNVEKHTLCEDNYNSNADSIKIRTDLPESR